MATRGSSNIQNRYITYGPPRNYLQDLLCHEFKCCFHTFLPNNIIHNVKLAIFMNVTLICHQVLLTSQNICSYRTDELGNGIGRIYYIVLIETRKNWVVTMKKFNIVVLKIIKCNIKVGQNNTFFTLVKVLGS